MWMRIVSTELRQVFRAYTKQLRGEYERAGESRGRESVAKGFERVDISPEAKILAQNLPHLPSVENPPVDKRSAADEPEEKDTEKEEKSSNLPKDPAASDRDKEIAN